MYQGKKKLKVFLPVYLFSVEKVQNYASKVNSEKYTELEGNFTVRFRYLNIFPLNPCSDNQMYYKKCRFERRRGAKLRKEYAFGFREVENLTPDMLIMLSTE